MTGSGSGSKGLYVAVGIVVVLVVVLYLFSQLNEIKEQVDTIANNQKTRPNEKTGKETAIDITPEKVTESTVQPDTTTAIVPQEELIANEETTSKPGSVADFHHSEDFRIITVNGVTHSLTLYQSRAVEKLWVALQNRVPELHQAAILEGIDSCSKRLRDIFKSNMVAFRVLIGRGDRKGTFKLKIA